MERFVDPLVIKTKLWWKIEWSKPNVTGDVILSQKVEYLSSVTPSGFRTTLLSNDCYPVLSVILFSLRCIRSLIPTQPVRISWYPTEDNMAYFCLGMRWSTTIVPLGSNPAEHFNVINGCKHWSLAKLRAKHTKLWFPLFLTRYLSKSLPTGPWLNLVISHVIKW